MNISVDRVAFRIPFVDFPVHWYALAYVVGVVLTKYIAMWVSRVLRNGVTRDDVEAFCNDGILAIVIGGRLGYVLCYNPVFYYNNPVEILKIYHGGMSFYGALVALIIAACVFVRRRGLSFFALSDVFVVGAPTGLFLGRIANLINQELPGYPYSGPLSICFSDGISRHPSQLYEAVLEGVLLFMILNATVLIKRDRLKRGALTVIFIVWYALARFVCEFFRMPDDNALNDILVQSIRLNFNQIVAIIMLLCGVTLWRRCKHGRIS